MTTSWVLTHVARGIFEHRFEILQRLQEIENLYNCRSNLYSDRPPIRFVYFRRGKRGKGERTAGKILRGLVTILFSLDASVVQGQGCI